MPQISKFIALAEEATYGTAGATLIYFKLLSEGIATSREDFYPETTDYWTSATYMDGFFRTAGSFDVLIDPVQWPKLLVLFIGDGNSAQSNGAAYTHTFNFGADEDVATTEIKPFTTRLGVGIEKDRQIAGNVIESITIEASKQNPVRSTVTITGSGNESLQTAKSQSDVETGWEAYTQPYLTFANAETMTIGGVDRLTTSPTIESFSLTLSRKWDAENYVLGNPFVNAPVLSGFAEVTGTMDLTFRSEDEYERYLSAVGGSGIGAQAPFELVLDLQGNSIGSTGCKYGVKITIPRARYNNSNINFTGRDRIVQTVEFKGLWDKTTDAAAKLEVTNIATAYTSLS